MKSSFVPLDSLREECGIFGAFGSRAASELVFLGLYALQHRGQESSGIVSVEEGIPHVHKGMGLVSDIFAEEVLAKLPGNAAIGHNRYSTTGSSVLTNAQPILVNLKGGFLAAAHNGNFVNARALRGRLEEQGAIFQSSLDTEVTVHLIARSRAPTLDEKILDALREIRGAYSMLLLTPEALYAARDPYGFRPLSLGTRRGGPIIAASETCALDLVEAQFLRDVEPGELVKISDSGIETFPIEPADRTALCIFEFIYFARPDSMIFGMSADVARRCLGRELAREHPVDGVGGFTMPYRLASSSNGPRERPAMS